MNLSGKAVKYWMDQEKIPLENVLVVTDDLNLPFGSLRVKTKGSDGGHNGLKDIQEIPCKPLPIPDLDLELVMPLARGDK